MDDEADLRELFSTILSDEHRVLTAGTGDEALETMTDEVDALLLDRRMAGLSGDEVVRRIRDNGYDIPIAMLTATEPDVDVLDLGIDEYIVKPVSSDKLLEVVERLIVRKEYDEVVRELYSLASKLAAIRSMQPSDTLEQSEQFVDASRRLEKIKFRARESLDDAFEVDRFEELLGESASTDRIFGRSEEAE